jgi:D-alanyl-D-alanine dipeptidase
MAIKTILADPRLLFPPFLSALSQGIELARKDGHPVEIFETYRAPARQQMLYDQGRTTQGPKVTNARPWQSWHQFGVAADIALKVRGRWSWEFDPAKIATYFEGLGLRWGGAQDGPHYELAGLPSLAAARAIVGENQGVLAFWASLP